MAVSPRPKTPRVRAAKAAVPTHILAHAEETKLNRLLAALPDAELKRWLPDLELVDLPLGHVLYESGATEPNVYFPTSAIVSSCT